jgi:hypothetical protein
MDLQPDLTFAAYTSSSAFVIYGSPKRRTPVVRRSPAGWTRLPARPR